MKYYLYKINGGGQATSTISPIRLKVLVILLQIIPFIGVLHAYRMYVEDAQLVDILYNNTFNIIGIVKIKKQKS